MSFVYPAFLYALFSILIPIIIHLFNFRKYRKVYFTNVKFLRELKQESQSKSRLKELLILASRILALSCLVLAFAQPVITDKQTRIRTGQKAIGIYIDNSFSMEGVNRNGSLLANARRRALEIVNAFGASDRFQLLTNDFEGKHQRFLSKEEMTDAINEVKISAAVKPLSAVIRRQSGFLKTSGASDLREFIISDVQRSTFDIANLSNDTTIGTTLIPLFANSSNNIYIDTCWFDSPVQQKNVIQKLNVRIVNKSDKAMESGSLKLIINGQQAAIASYNADAGAKTETKITFACKREGFNFCSLKIDDYPVSFDDELFFTFNSRLEIRAVLINGQQAQSASFFRTLMQNDSMFRFSEMPEQAIDFAAFKNANIIFLNELDQFPSGLSAELMKFTNNGGHLVIIPSPKASPDAYRSFLSTLQLPSLSEADTTHLRLEKTDLKQGFYEGVFDKMDERMDLPVILKHYPLSATTRSNLVPVLKLQNGETWLGEATRGHSRVYLFAGALSPSFTNFCRHALFVPTIYKMAINSLQPLPLYYYTQSNSAIPVSNLSDKGEEPIHITRSDNKFDVIPENRIVDNRITVFTQNQVSEPGFYNITYKKNALQSLAFNYNRVESDLSFYTATDLEKQLEERHLSSFKTLIAGEKQITAGIQDIGGNTKLWKLFIILALVFVATEIALIKFLK